MFEPGVTYNVDDRGAIITRAGARQAARLAGEAAAQQQAEEEAIAAGTPDEATEALLRGEHEYHISGQILAAEIRARNADAVTAAQEAAAREAEPAKPPAFFVKRGALFMHTAKAKLRVGEEIFTRQPNGQWWVGGLVDVNGGLPPPQEVI